jgi:hypothetical protein
MKPDEPVGLCTASILSFSISAIFSKTSTIYHLTSHLQHIPRYRPIISKNRQSVKRIKRFRTEAEGRGSCGLDPAQLFIE